MKLGLITKVAVTPANVSDGEALRHICPKESVVLADKGYCGRKPSYTMEKNGCINKAILKNTMKNKDFKRDSWISKNGCLLKGSFQNNLKKLVTEGLVRPNFKHLCKHSLITLSGLF